MPRRPLYHFGFAGQEGRYFIGGILSWSLRAMSEVPTLAAASWPEPEVSLARLL
jgi:hypothetical protein